MIARNAGAAAIGVILHFATGSAALAGNTLAGVRADTGVTQPGKPVTLTVTTTDDKTPANCGLRIEFGDGSVEDMGAAGPDGLFPKTFSKAYGQPGSFTVRVSGRPFGALAPCAGSATATVRVDAPAPATAPAAAAPTAAVAPVAPSAAPARSVVQEFSLCPPGWTLAGEAAKDGSFACNQVKPARLACPEGLAYFEKPGVMGCRKPAAKR